MRLAAPRDPDQLPDRGLTRRFLQARADRAAPVRAGQVQLPRRRAVRDRCGRSRRAGRLFAGAAAARELQAHAARRRARPVAARIFAVADRSEGAQQQRWSSQGVDAGDDHAERRTADRRAATGRDAAPGLMPAVARAGVFRPTARRPFSVFRPFAWPPVGVPRSGQKGPLPPVPRA